MFSLTTRRCEWNLEPGTTLFHWTNITACVTSRLVSHNGSERKHKEKEEFSSFRFGLCLRQARFHEEVSAKAFMSALVLAPLVKTKR